MIYKFSSSHFLISGLHHTLLYICMVGAEDQTHPTKAIIFDTGSITDKTKKKNLTKRFIGFTVYCFKTSSYVQYVL